MEDIYGLVILNVLFFKLNQAAFPLCRGQQLSFLQRKNDLPLDIHKKRCVFLLI